MSSKLMPNESRPESEPDIFGLQYRVTRFVGTTLITLSALAFLWGVGIYILGYRGFSIWEQFWFVAACSAGSATGYCIFRTVERLEELCKRNAALTRINGQLSEEVERLKAKIVRLKAKS
jgi:hypothetical protein